MTAVEACAAPDCDAPAVVAVHPLPFDGAPDVLRVCLEHAGPLEPYEDPARPRRGLS